MKKLIPIVLSSVILTHCFANNPPTTDDFSNRFIPEFAFFENQGWPIAWLDEYTNLYKNIKVHEHRKVILKTSNVINLFDNVQTINTIRHDMVSQTNAIILGEKRRIFANSSKPYKNATILLYQQVPEIYAYLRSCSRPSFAGVIQDLQDDASLPDDLRPLIISKANFISYFEPIDFVRYFYNNIVVDMQYATIPEDHRKGAWLPDCMLTIGDWLFVANRINSLFDGDIASLARREDLKLQKSNDMTLSIIERKQTSDGESVTLHWSVPSEFKGNWIRFDTSEGRASIEDEETQTVTVSHIPPNTPIIGTLYAVSPNGKDWHYTTLAIPSIKNK